MQASGEDGGRLGWVRIGAVRWYTFYVGLEHGLKWAPVMKYLKKDMVRRVIELARVCPPPRDFTPEEIAMGARGSLQVDPAVAAFNSFLKDIGAGAVSELTALMWLGRDLGKSPEAWEEMVAAASGPDMRDIYTVPKARLGQFLRTGMERLVRANRFQQMAATPGRIILAAKTAEDAPAPRVAPTKAKAARVAPPSVSAHRRHELAGRFVIDAFGRKFGEEGLSKLGRLMAAAGFLSEEADKALFGLEPIDVFAELEGVLAD